MVGWFFFGILHLPACLHSEQQIYYDSSKVWSLSKPFVRLYTAEGGLEIIFREHNCSPHRLLLVKEYIQMRSIARMTYDWLTNTFSRLESHRKSSLRCPRKGCLCSSATSIFCPKFRNWTSTGIVAIAFF